MRPDETSAPPDTLPGNPFREIWQATQQALERTARTQPERLCLALAALSGVADVVTRLVVAGHGRPSLAQLGLWVGLVAPLFGLARVYGLGLAIHRVGRWLGGQASYAEVRGALAWATLPEIALLGLWLPLFLFVGRDLFALQFYMERGSGLAALLAMLCALAALAAGVTGLVRAERYLAMAQRLSHWRATVSLLGGVLLVALAGGAMVAGIVSR